MFVVYVCVFFNCFCQSTMLPLKLNAKVTTVRIVDICFVSIVFVILCLYVVLSIFVCVCNLFFLFMARTTL